MSHDLPPPRGDDMPDVPRKRPDEEPGILDKPGLIKRWMRILFAAAVLLLLADFLYHPHFHTDLESGGGIKGFYGLYGFAGLVILVLGAILLRQIVMRPENYYDEEGRDE